MSNIISSTAIDCFKTVCVGKDGNLTTVGSERM